MKKKIVTFFRQASLDEKMGKSPAFYHHGFNDTNASRCLFHSLKHSETSNFQNNSRVSGRNLPFICVADG